jgi:hypothetical protein
MYITDVSCEAVTHVAHHTLLSVQGGATIHRETFPLETCPAENKIEDVGEPACRLAELQWDWAGPFPVCCRSIRRSVAVEAEPLVFRAFSEM